MPAKDARERAEVLSRVADRLSAHGTKVSLQQAYDMFKEIESEMEAAEDDSELYSALADIRKELRKAMDARAQELGQSEDWARTMGGHDDMLMLRPLYRALDDPDPQQFLNTYRALSVEQKAALEYWEKKTGKRLPRPEAIEAEFRWIEIRRKFPLRLIPPDPDRRTGGEFLKAIFLALVLAGAISSTVESRFWGALLFVLLLSAVVITTWVRDFISAKRRKPPKVAANSK
jgi:hypothetical protein